MMEKNGFTVCANAYIGCLRKEGRFATAHIYQHALRSFVRFTGTSNVPFCRVTREYLRSYCRYLYEHGLKPNTISTYMRMLRSIYNRGVEAGNAPYIPRLFRDVYTGVDVRQKKALPVGELHKLLYEDPGSEQLRHTQAMAALMFQFCGMPFVDFAYMEKSALQQNVLHYNRVKTRTPMSIEVLDTAKELINQLRNKHIPLPGYPDYLFNVLSGNKKRKEESAYREYQSALRLFNNRLKGLARALHLSSLVTSYTAKHNQFSI